MNTSQRKGPAACAMEAQGTQSLIPKIAASIANILWRALRKSPLRALRLFSSRPLRKNFAATIVASVKMYFVFLFCIRAIQPQSLKGTKFFMKAKMRMPEFFVSSWLKKVFLFLSTSQRKQLSLPQRSAKGAKGFLLCASRLASFASSLRVPQEPCVKILFVFLLFFSANLSAQSTTDSLPTPSHALIGRYQGDSIELRWAPASYAIWQHAVENGWKLERLELSKSLYNLNDQTPLTGDDNLSQMGGGLLFPWNEEQWKARVSKTDSNTAAALQLLYGPADIPAGSDPLAAMAQLQQDQGRRHGFAMMAADFSTVTANALGLRFVDRKLTPGKAYLYRLYIPVGDAELDLDTIDIVVDTRSPWVSKKVQKVFTESGDMEVSVNWPTLNDAFFTAYDVERSTDQKSWKKLNHRPYVVSKSFSKEAANFFVDTTLEKNYKNYFYRVRGYSAFGDKGLWSDVVSGLGKDFKAPAPAFDIKVIDLGSVSGTGQRVKIQWGAFASEKDIKGFYVGKSDAAAGEFPKISKLLPVNTREFIDNNVDPIASNYYVVFVADTSGNESQSYVAYADLQDTVAPEKPVGLTAEIDTFGNVFLNWTEGKEMDIIGYRVYWANDKNAEFSQITGDLVPGINYVDSIELNTLTEHVYYRIAAVDHRYNHSEMSDVLQMQRPDKVAPVAPVITGYQISGSSVTFQWIPSSSADVVKQELFRSVGDGPGETRIEIPAKSAAYRDSVALAGTHYTYSLRVTDDAGNSSVRSFPLRVNVIDNSVRGGIKNLKVDWDAKTATAALKWALPAGKVAKVLVYHNMGEGLTFHRSLDGTAETFTEKPFIDVRGYAIKLIYTDGTESELGAEVALPR